jgi:hypothetical protein
MIRAQFGAPSPRLPRLPPLRTDLSQQTHAHEVISGHVQDEHLVAFLQPAHYHFAHASHGVHPAKALFDQLALLLR